MTDTISTSPGRQTSERIAFVTGDRACSSFTGPDLNVSRLAETVGWVREQAARGKHSLWNQSHWIHHKDEAGNLNWDQPGLGECGTVGCAAGHVALQDGLKVKWVEGCGWEDYRSPHDLRTALEELHLSPAEFEEASKQPYYKVLAEQDTYAMVVSSISGYAQYVLGLTDLEADLLFNGDNTLGDIEAVFKSLVDAELARLRGAELIDPNATPEKVAEAHSTALLENLLFDVWNEDEAFADREVFMHVIAAKITEHFQ